MKRAGLRSGRVRGDVLGDCSVGWRPLTPTPGASGRRSQHVGDPNPLVANPDPNRTRRMAPSPAPCNDKDIRKDPWVQVPCGTVSHLAKAGTVLAFRMRLVDWLRVGVLQSRSRGYILLLGRLDLLGFRAVGSSDNPISGPPGMARLVKRNLEIVDSRPRRVSPGRSPTWSSWRESMPVPHVTSCGRSALPCRAERTRLLRDSHLLGVVSGVHRDGPGVVGALPAAANSAVFHARHDDGRGFGVVARPPLLNTPAYDADAVPVGAGSIDRQWVFSQWH